jgi:hypothetical protein
MTGFQLFGWLVLGWVALLAATVVAGFLGQAVGLWASVIWGVGFLSGAVYFIRRRRSAG